MSDKPSVIISREIEKRRRWIMCRVSQRYLARPSAKSRSRPSRAARGAALPVARGAEERPSASRRIFVGSGPVASLPKKSIRAKSAMRATAETPETETVEKQAGRGRAGSVSGGEGADVPAGPGLYKKKVHVRHLHIKLYRSRPLFLSPSRVLDRDAKRSRSLSSETVERFFYVRLSDNFLPGMVLFGIAV